MKISRNVLFSIGLFMIIAIYSDGYARSPHGRHVIFRDGSVPMTCAYQDDVDIHEKAEPCREYFGRGTGRHSKDEYYQWRGRRGHIYTFVGRLSEADFWSFGLLNGKPAACYKLSREHYVFSTKDLSIQFEAWVEGF